MMLERTACGLELTRTWKKTKLAPYRHACRCAPRVWSSSEICHRCSCVACTKARANWDKFIKAGGIAGEERRRREGT